MIPLKVSEPLNLLYPKLDTFNDVELDIQGEIPHRSIASTRDTEYAIASVLGHHKNK